MGDWKDGETFSKELLDVIRITREYELETLENREQDYGQYAIEDIRVWAIALSSVASTIRQYGPPNEWNNQIKSMVGGQLALVLCGIIALLGDLSDEPDLSAHSAFTRIYGDGVQQLQKLLNRKIDQKTKENLASVISEAERIINGY